MTFPTGSSRHCMIFVVDIMDFTGEGRDDLVQIALRRSLYRLVSHSFNGAELPWHVCLREDRGDGILVIVPVPIPVGALAPMLARRLGRSLAEHNQSAADLVRIRLRAALHIGVVHRDPYGVVGGSVNHAFRLLNAPTLRDVLTLSTTDLALIVSSAAYQGMLHADGTCPLTLRPVVAETKRSKALAWIWMGTAG